MKAPTKLITNLFAKVIKNKFKDEKSEEKKDDAKSESKKSEKTEKAEPSDRSVAKAEGSFADRQSYKRATQEAQADEKRKAMGMKKGGSVGSASKRADGIATRGKTRGRMV